jgi:hypothetical protein
MHADHSRKLARAGYATIVLSLFASSVTADPVVMSGGWVADFSPSMKVAADSGTTVFELQGSYKLSGLKRGKWASARGATSHSRKRVSAGRSALPAGRSGTIR